MSEKSGLTPRSKCTYPAPQFVKLGGDNMQHNLVGDQAYERVGEVSSTRTCERERNVWGAHLPKP